MVVLSEAGRVTLVVFLLATSTVGGVWLYTAYTGPLQDEPPRHYDAEGVFLVSYPLATHELETQAVAFDGMGRIRMDGIRVPVQNVTSVEMILQVAMGGPAFGDTYTITVTDPVGETRSGSHSVPQPSTGGYIRSDTVIDWHRRVHPTSETYQTMDREEAARWSAENQTDTSANGDWSALIELNQPPLGRSGNASLLLRVAHYEAVILPQTEVVPPSPTPTMTNTTAPGNDTDPDDDPDNDTHRDDDVTPKGPTAAGHPAARPTEFCDRTCAEGTLVTADASPALHRSSASSASVPREAVEPRSFEGAPRTFITTPSVGETR